MTAYAPNPTAPRIQPELDETDFVVIAPAPARHVTEDVIDDLDSFRDEIGQYLAEVTNAGNIIKAGFLEMDIFRKSFNEATEKVADIAKGTAPQSTITEDSREYLAGLEEHRGELRDRREKLVEQYHLLQHYQRLVQPAEKALEGDKANVAGHEKNVAEYQHRLAALDREYPEVSYYDEYHSQRQEMISELGRLRDDFSVDNQRRKDALNTQLDAMKGQAPDKPVDYEEQKAERRQVETEIRHRIIEVESVYIPEARAIRDNSAGKYDRVLRHIDEITAQIGELERQVAGIKSTIMEKRGAFRNKYPAILDSLLTRKEETVAQIREIAGHFALGGTVVIEGEPGEDKVMEVRWVSPHKKVEKPAAEPEPDIELGRRRGFRRR